MSYRRNVLDAVLIIGTYSYTCFILKYLNDLVENSLKLIDRDQNSITLM